MTGCEGLCRQLHTGLTHVKSRDHPCVDQEGFLLLAHAENKHIVLQLHQVLSK